MYITQSGTFSVAASIGVLLQIREGGSVTARSLCFENLTASDLQVTLEESTDGGGRTLGRDVVPIKHGRRPADGFRRPGARVDAVAEDILSVMGPRHAC